MADPFARALNRLSARLGTEAVLRGADPCRVSVAKGVAVSGEYGQVIAGKTTIEILTPGMNAKSGDEITADGEEFTLESRLKNDGYSDLWIVR